MMDVQAVHDKLEAVHDKLEIGELLYRYARSVDTKDWEALASVFTDDAHLDYSSVGYPPGSRDEVVAILSRAVDAVPMTQHFISNIQIRLDGDRADVTAMFYNPHAVARHGRAVVLWRQLPPSGRAYRRRVEERAPGRGESLVRQSAGPPEVDPPTRTKGVAAVPNSGDAPRPAMSGDRPPPIGPPDRYRNPPHGAVPMNILPGLPR